MAMTTTEKLQTYIEDELKDSELYMELAKIAPTPIDRQLLLEFSKNEYTHAETFKNIYQSLTGRSYDPEIPPPVLEGNFYQIIHNRILDESRDYKKYGEQYLLTNNNPRLKDAYYRARTDENVHALRLIYILSETAS